jgi:hypothetical protein
MFGITSRPAFEMSERCGVGGYEREMRGGWGWEGRICEVISYGLDGLHRVSSTVMLVKNTLVEMGFTSF